MKLPHVLVDGDAVKLPRVLAWVQLPILPHGHRCGRREGPAGVSQSPPAPISLVSLLPLTPFPFLTLTSDHLDSGP